MKLLRGTTVAELSHGTTAAYPSQNSQTADPSRKISGGAYGIKFVRTLFHIRYN